MILLFVQKLMLAGFLAVVGMCLLNSGRSNWDQKSLKEMLKFQSIPLKLLSSITKLGVFTGIILVPFTKTWLWFITGCILYVLGNISHNLVFEFSRSAWINKKMKKS